MKQDMSSRERALLVLVDDEVRPLDFLLLVGRASVMIRIRNAFKTYPRRSQDTRRDDLYYKYEAGPPVSR
jgi:hypothetical protein